MNELIISLAVNGRENYEANLRGLEKSIKDLWEGDNRIYRAFPGFVTPHDVMPYQFKFQLIKQAVKDGYTRIWWLDSTMRLKNNISDLLTNSDSGIVAFKNLGHELKNYISDLAVGNLIDSGLLDGTQHLNFIDQTWGGAVGWDFNNPVALIVFNKVLQQIELGSFLTTGSERKGFIAHRHDQSCLSVIFDRYNVKLLPYGVIAAKPDVTELTYIQYGD